MSPGPLSSDPSVLSVATPRTARTIFKQTHTVVCNMSAAHDNNSQPIKTALDGNIKQNQIVIKAEIGEVEWRAAKRYFMVASLPRGNYKVKDGLPLPILTHGNMYRFTVSFSTVENQDNVKGAIVCSRIALQHSQRLPFLFRFRR